MVDTSEIRRLQAGKTDKPLVTPSNGQALIYNATTGRYEGGAGGGGSSDHGTLTGLADDDHTQYHNSSRADAWLATKSTTNLAEGTNLYHTTGRVNTILSSWAGSSSITTVGTLIAGSIPVSLITGLGSLAALNTVGTSQIDADSVTYAKIQNVTDARLLGRSAGSAGDCQEITVGSGLSLSGGELSATGGGGVSDGDKGDITVSASGATWTIDNDAVTYAKIQNVSATDKLLGRSTAGAGDIEEIACTAAGRAILDDADAAAQRATLSAGYALNASALNAATLTDAQTIYFGSKSVAPTTTANITRLYIPRAGTIKRAYVHGNFGTAGTAEAWTMYIRLNNTTDTSIETIAVGATSRLWSNTALSITVAAGDYIEIKSINPTWATNPANMTISAVIYVE